MRGGLARRAGWLGCQFSRAESPIRSVRSHPIQPSLPVDPLHTSRLTTRPFPFDPHSPSVLLAPRSSLVGSSLLARRHGLHPRSLAAACYAPSTTVGAHRRWIRAGEEEVRRPSLPPRCALAAAALSPSVRSSAAAVRSAEKMGEGGDKGKEHPNPAPSLFPSCMRPGEVDGEGRRHGQRRRYHCTGTSTSRDQIWCGTCGIMHRHVILAMIYAGDLAINRGIWTTNDVIFTRGKRSNCGNQ